MRALTTSTAPVKAAIATAADWVGVGRGHVLGVSALGRAALDR
jgi:hypothetical protein